MINMVILAKGFTKLMSMINRKQIPVCRSCHNLIHQGKYDGIAIGKLKPKDKKR